jgi:hypothetical protein
MLELKRMGIDVLKMAQDAHMTARDMAHDHAQNSMDRALEYTMHQNDHLNAPEPTTTQ